ncbi:unnamed protein product [Ranitomeya imitator]|uniref:Uncharacterized protein n=1 Tax=Ranitomeya imitator TaxID=111125 RepID=A0ABN9MP53_9NEOB|nr:unnamed protein product [Ranitomeya imitator]
MHLQNIPTCADPGQAPVDLTEETYDSSAMDNEDEEGPSTLDLQTLKFADYLQKTLRVQSYKQEVENVTRFLYYMDPEHTSRGLSFFNKLQDLKFTSQTIFNYLKHLKRFVHHQLRASNLAHENCDLYNSFKIFKGVTKDIQTRLSKGISKEVVGKRQVMSHYDLYKALNTPTTAAEAQKILDVAKPEFLTCIRKIRAGSKAKKQLQILNYLECLLVLKHGQRPGVFFEWERVQHQYKGEDFVVIGVKLHKTSTQQVASFVLTPNEEEEGFLSFLTAKVGMYSLPLVTSQMVRKLLESWTNSKCTDVQQRLVARHLIKSGIIDTNSRQASNISAQERKAILSLKTNKEIIIIKPADSGCAIVMMNTSDYMKEAYRQLKNTLV